MNENAFRTIGPKGLDNHVGEHVLRLVVCGGGEKVYIDYPVLAGGSGNLRKFRFNTRDGGKVSYESEFYFSFPGMSSSFDDPLRHGDALRIGDRDYIFIDESN